MTVGSALLQLARNPGDLLVRRWNWKSAALSPICRSQIFLALNLSAGWRAALGAMAAEFAYRSLAAGFYGALTQSFRGATPPWLAGLTVAVLLPLVSHSIELLVHWARGTPHLKASMVASVGFTAVSTTFNWYAMRRGVLMVGAGSASLVSDLRRMPRLLWDFLVCGPVALWRIVAASSRLSGIAGVFQAADSSRD